jgi:glycosyltransferase involved in cell wall biosynthesis
MRTVLVVHNRYQQPGGEDQVFASESAMLEREGHSVIRYEENNARINGGGPGAAVSAIWSGRSAQKIGELVRRHKPDVVHFHNTFPLISPAAYYAVRKEGVPVVQTLHNFRLVCPGATLFRDGAVCEECIDQRSFRPAMAHKCYRGSRPATAATAAMLALHGMAGTWRSKVDRYIALSEFSRRKFMAGGLPEKKLVVKPNFVSPDPGPGKGEGGFALFVGRLSAGKGVGTMLSAWKELGGIRLVVAGDGPMAAEFGDVPDHQLQDLGALTPKGTVRSVRAGHDHELQDLRALGQRGLSPSTPSNVEWVGRLAREKVLELMRAAKVLIFPSVWYEGAPMAIAEAFACGLPVIASSHGRTGLLFEAGDAADLARTVRWAFEHGREMEAMRAEARREFEEKYTAERNYEMLMGIYEGVIEKRAARASHA